MTTIEVWSGVRAMASAGTGIHCPPLTFTAYGIPQSAGSKRAFPFHKAGGKMGVRVTDSNPKGKAWRDTLTYAALEAAGSGFTLFSGPLCATVEFVMPRPASHYGKRGGQPYLKPDAPLWHTSKPDATKLWRCAEDALKGVVVTDDSIIAQQHISKQYGERPRCTITLTPLSNIDPRNR